jgi:hypothetical protein
MHTPVVRLTGLLALAWMLVALPGRAEAQEEGMGLDLSSETSQPESTEMQEIPAEGGEQPGIGLDLSGEVSGAELLPRVVLLGVETPERAGAAAASRWVRALYTALRGTMEQAVPGASIKDARERLAEGYDAALRCAEASCFTEPADTLDADLLVTSRLALEDGGWTFRLWTFDRDRNKVETDELSGRNPRDAKFQQGAAALLAKRVRELARPRALLKVKVNVPQAVVRLGERTLGVGNIEARVAPGEGSLFVEADEFSPYAKTVNLPPGETTTVEVYLEGAGPAPEGPTDVVAETRRKADSSGPTVFGRPALYTAVVGILAVGAGVIMGQGAQKVATRAVDADGNGIVDITRGERLNAQRQANLSTALVVGGSAVAGASLVWLVIVPTRSEAPRAATPGAPGSGGGGSTSLHLFVGGSF